MNSPAILFLFGMPNEVAWSYFVFFAILTIGLATILRRDAWQKARGFDKLILFGPVFYAAPVAAFGTEHFTITKDIAGIIPKWIPWHYFWAYFVGACFIAAGLSLATKVFTRLAASLLALTFFLFVVLMDAPGWARDFHNRFSLALTLRELSFGAGPLALAASLGGFGGERAARIQAIVARYFIAVGVLVYSVQQFMHGDHVPGIPLPQVMPDYVLGHAVWTYLTASVYAVAAILLLAGRKTRAAATAVGAVVVFVVLVVYVQFAVVEHTSFVGFNYLADTLMYGGTVLLLAGAMPKENS